MDKLLPLELGNVPPNEDYQRLVPRYPHPHGIPEGVHTGGPFIDPTGKWVWKPTDVRPWVNCEFRVYSREVEALRDMAGFPGFPLNWELVEQNGRQWIVRRFALVVQSDELTLAQAEEIHQAIKVMNDFGWMLNDPIVVALDPHGSLFIVDLSNVEGIQKGWEKDDRRRQLRRYYDWLGFGWIEEAERYRAEDRAELEKIEQELLKG